MVIKQNPDKEYAAEIKRKLKENGGYCPCSLLKTESRFVWSILIFLKVWNTLSQNVLNRILLKDIHPVMN